MDEDFPGQRTTPLPKALKIIAICFGGIILVFGGVYAAKMPGVKTNLALLMAALKDTVGGSVSMSRQETVSINYDGKASSSQENIAAPSPKRRTKEASGEVVVPGMDVPQEREKRACVFASPKADRQSVRINEINWMGNDGDPNAEWFELVNTGTSTVELSGWSVIGKDEKFKAEMSDRAIPPFGFAVFSRGSDYVGALPNSGMSLRLLNDDCLVEDEILAEKNWPAGDNAMKQTMERTKDGSAWYTSAKVGGTPEAKNSTMVVAVKPPGAISTTSTQSESTVLPSTQEPPPQTTPSQETIPEPDPIPVPPPPPPAPEEPLKNILITEVGITGGEGATDHDFIVVSNPNTRDVAIESWRLKKRTKSGTEYSVKVFSVGSVIPGGGIFTWANSKSGFSESIHANTSSTQTLSADTSIALIDADGRIIDALAWGSGHVTPYIEGEAYPENPGANERLARKTADSIFIDTDRNASDFEKR